MKASIKLLLTNINNKKKGKAKNKCLNNYSFLGMILFHTAVPGI
jgi:hypothetical protein